MHVAFQLFSQFNLQVCGQHLRMTPANYTSLHSVASTWLDLKAARRDALASSGLSDWHTSDQRLTPANMPPYARLLEMETARRDTPVSSGLSHLRTNYRTFPPVNIPPCAILLEIETARRDALVSSGLSNMHTIYQRLTPANIHTSLHKIAWKVKLRVATR